MIKLVAYKDFLLNLTSARFVIGFIICLLIIPFTLIVSVNRYNNQLNVYKVNAERAEKELNSVRVYSFVRPEVVRVPEPLSIFSEGITENLGVSAKIQISEYPLFLSGHVSKQNNPFLNAFATVDFTTVIAIIMSLLALVFSYDCFTRERENGTLKMVLSNQISRTSFFTGKFLGILLTLLPMLLFCYLLSILFIVLSPTISFTSGNWGDIAILFLSSILFIIVFILLGMFISSLTQRSSTSIIISLLLWIWFLFLVPHIASYVAKSFTRIGMYDNVKYAMLELDKEYGKKREEKKYEVIDKVIGSRPQDVNMRMYSDLQLEISTFWKHTFDFYLIMMPWEATEHLNYADKKWAIQKKYLDDLLKQERVRQWMACLSPSEIFGQLSSSLCRTDANAYYKYMDMVREYRQIFIQYFKDKKLFESTLYFTPQDINTATLKPEEQADWDNIPEYLNLESYPPLNFDDIPKFNLYISINSIEFVMYRIILLLLIVIALLVATIIRFRNYNLQ